MCPDQPDHIRTVDAPGEPIDQDAVTDRVDELAMSTSTNTRSHVRPRDLDRDVRAPHGPEPVVVVAEAGIDLRLQHMRQCLLDQPIQHLGDAQLVPEPISLGNHHPSLWLGPSHVHQKHLVGRRPART